MSVAKALVKRADSDASRSRLGVAHLVPPKVDRRSADTVSSEMKIVFRGLSRAPDRVRSSSFDTR
jgi:hypothetical protein